MQGVPGLAYMSGTSKGISFSWKEDRHVAPSASPGSLQHSSQALVSGSSGPCAHWHDSRPYARQMEPVHSWNEWKGRTLE